MLARTHGVHTHTLSLTHHSPVQFILSFFGFGFPIALTAWHQVFCTTVMWVACLFGVKGAERVEISR